MTFQSVPECAEAVIGFTADGKVVNNVLGFWFPGGYAQGDIDNLADAVDSVVGSDYLPIVSIGVNYNQTLVRGLENIVDLTATNSDNAGVGGVAGGALPSNVSLCITNRSAFTGRSARGRFYLVPTGSSQLNTENTFGATYINNAEAMLLGMKTAAAAFGWTMVIISRFSNNAKRGTGTHYTVTNSAARNNLIDSQRGRLPAGH